MKGSEKSVLSKRIKRQQYGSIKAIKNVISPKVHATEDRFTLQVDLLIKFYNKAKERMVGKKTMDLQDERRHDGNTEV